MTKQNYERFAAMFAGELALNRCISDAVVRDHRIKQVRNIIFSTADIFAQDNPRFDRDRFYRACGLY